MSAAKVYLVGAGPGDAGLLTVKGRELLQRADAVIYDYLASDALLGLVRPGARLVDVGKKGFEKHLTQEQINDLLVDLCREFSESDDNANVPESAQMPSKDDNKKIIVRLKGGDPFVFGRGGEEALALRAAGIDFEVVPGITSGIAAPAYAGIPVTHRKVASSVTFVTGHEDPTRAESSIDWEALARLCAAGNTLCFYMGVRNIRTLAGRLVEHGAPAETPVSLVRWGTTQQQEELHGVLDNIADLVDECGFAAPAIIVVGRVCALGSELQWFEKGPLAGQRVVVTRSRSQASALSERLRALGASVQEVPTIAFEEPESYEPLDTCIGKLERYQWVVFTSVNGVDAFFARLERAGLDARGLAAAKIAGIGPATARRLKRHGITADVIPDEYRAEAVFEAIAAQGPLDGVRVLVPRAQVAREVLPQLLRAAGAEVDVVAAYRTVAPLAETADALREQLESGEVDAVTFTSSSTANNLVKMLGDDAQRLLEGVALCSIGPITSATLREHGLEPAVQASEYTIEGLVQAMAGAPSRP